MRIEIAKRGRRNELRCVRSDGSCEVASLGPGLPHHDLAHFVVESRWNLRAGPVRWGPCSPERVLPNSFPNWSIQNWTYGICPSFR